MRSDPSDNGGLFVGRRPGTAPVRFRALPERGGELRQRVDGSLANMLLAAITFVSLLCWGPIPIACLWLGSQADYLSGNVGVGILVAFAGLFALLFGALALLRRIDTSWILVRRRSRVRDYGGRVRGDLRGVVRGHPRARLQHRLRQRRTVSHSRPARPAAARGALAGRC
jgi:hypothetical protein